MQSLLRLVRTTLIGGLLFLVPIVALVAVLEKAHVVALKIVAPLAARLPVESVIGLDAPVLLAVALIVSFCLLTGLFARTALAQRIVEGLETSVLSKVPGYAFLRSVTRSMVGVEDDRGYPVVLARFDDTWQLGLRVEELDNGLCAVFVPGAPDPQSGAVHFLGADRLTPVAVSLSAALSCLKRRGSGSGVLLRDLPVRAPSAKSSV